MDEVQENSVVVSTLDPLQNALVSLFMYFLGNTDFSLIQGPPGEKCCHNSKLLASGESLFPIPYDFDASGFVDASYAPEPLPRFRIRSNRTRLYRGFCVRDPIMDEALANFRSIETEVTEMITERRARGFVVDFFDTINDPRDLRREILEKCR